MGRPSTNCSHCKDIRKAKYAQARCVCGRQEALKHSKSDSYDGRSCRRAGSGGDGLVSCASSDGCDIAGAACSIASAAACPCSQQDLEEQQQGACFHPETSTQNNVTYCQQQGIQPTQNPDTSINGTFAGMALHGTDPSASVTSKPMPSHRQSHLCYDYASSSDCESDHCNSSAQVCYPNSGHNTIRTSDDFNERNLNASRTLQSLVDDNSTSSSSRQPPQSYPTNIPSSASAKTSCCKSSTSTSSPAISTPPSPPPIAERVGCGCAISPTMCCCGEFCACPGCLAYPNNQPVPVQEYQGATFSSNTATESYANIRSTMDQRPVSKGSCCGSNNSKSNNNPLASGGGRNLNLGEALTLIGVSHQTGSMAMNDEIRQALQQGFGAMDQATLDSVKMQHPTLLGSNGVLTCGCGCGRPTVDCADCFRDMCEFVGESQARMMKDEFEYEMSMSSQDGFLGGQGLSRNMSSGMNSCHSTSMELDDEPQQFDQGTQHEQRQKLTEQEEAIRLRRLEQEQMELSKLRPATFNQLQLDSLDDEDWSFVDEIRTDPLDTHNIVSHS
ncbi:hypothetical protein EC991_008895 [Linnemannia zychae]|nr:hypothetical protein EC991_008895 [Linnemannia zychae]